MIRRIALLLSLLVAPAQAATPTQTPQWGWDGSVLQYKIGGSWTVFSPPSLGANNTWTGTNTFSNNVTLNGTTNTILNLPILSACTGYLYGNAASAVSCATAISTASLSGTLLAAQFPVLTGDVTTAGGALATTVANNAVTNAKAAQMATNTVKANVTSGTANAADFSMPSCSAATNGLTWTTNTGFTCNSSINAATLGGATFASPGAIGGSAAGSGAFTTLSASSTVSGTGFSTYLASPPAIGGTAAAAGKFTTLQATNATTLAAGTTSIAPLTFQSGTNLTTATAGVQEYDGTVFYNTNSANSRGVSPSIYWVSLTSTRTLTSNTSAQAIFAGGGGPTNGQITLPVGTYFFDAFLVGTSFSNTNPHTLTFGLAGTATISSVLAMVSDVGNSSTGFVTMTSTTAALSYTANTTPSISVTGVFRVSVAGTVIPQITQSVAAAGVFSVGTYLRLHSVGLNSAAFVGNWN